jgi:hypothetical protein
MALDVTVSLSQSTYERVKQWATLQQQDVETVIAEYLDTECVKDIETTR